MAAVDTTYHIPRGTVQLVTGEAIAAFVMVQNMSKYPCAVWFQDAAPALGTDRPDIIWGGGAYEEAFPNPKVSAGGANTQVYMSPAGNAPFTTMRVIHVAAA